MTTLGNSSVAVRVLALSRLRSAQRRSHGTHFGWRRGVEASLKADTSHRHMIQQLFPNRLLQNEALVAQTRGSLRSVWPNQALQPTAQTASFFVCPI
jgi:hypothetical protein